MVRDLEESSAVHHVTLDTRSSVILHTRSEARRSTRSTVNPYTQH